MKKDKDLHGKVWRGDNLAIMRQLPSASVPFVYLDPPFMSARDYEKDGHRFTDKWTEDQFKKEDLMSLMHAGLRDYLRSVPSIHGFPMAAYLLAMSLRLKEMKRILTANGSIYLHCDASASHYLKICMDAIFGKDWFREEVVWRRLCSGHYRVNQSWGRITDSILFYAGPNNTFHPIYIPYKEGWLDKEFRYKDNIGFYRKERLTKSHMGKKKKEGKIESTTAWKGINPVKDRLSGWAVPKDSKYAQWLEKHHIPNYTKMGTHERLDALDKVGMILCKNNFPEYKRYREGHGYEGLRLNNLILDTFLGSNTVYPTQKPIKLLEYLIQTSTNEGELVLDPFCGSGTTLVAAHNLGRKFCGIDRNAVIETIQKRIDRGGCLLSQPVKVQQVF